jgi:hypothetical protein
MPKKFVAQSLVETRVSNDERRLELTLAGTKGDSQILTLPMSLATDLASVLVSAAKNSKAVEARLTKMPSTYYVGHATYQRLVLVKFDDDPPYALNLEDARMLSRQMLDESETAARSKVPALQ